MEADEEIGPVMKFRMSDFAISAEVSVGLHGRVRYALFFKQNVDFLVLEIEGAYCRLVSYCAG